MIAYMMLIDEPDKKEIFKQLYYKYRNLMYTTAYTILNDEYDAEDAVSDAFLEIAKNFDRISANCKNLKAYYALSAKNKAISIYNKKNKIKKVSLEDAGDISIDSFLEDFGDSEIMEKISQLEPRYKQVFYMYYIEELTVKNIAKTLKISTSCVYKYINSGKKQLIRMLEEV